MPVMEINAMPNPEPGALRGATTLALVGAKGGVGTTLLASSLAWALAQRRQRVVLLDLDERGGQAALHLCERNAGPTLHDALQVMDRMDETLLDTLLTPCSPGLRLLPAPRRWPDGMPEPLSAAHLTRLLRSACGLADWVVLDLPHEAPCVEAYGPLLRLVDDLTLVSEPTLPATFNARRAWQRLQAHRRPAPTGESEGLNLNLTPALSTALTLALNKAHRHHALAREQVLRTIGVDEAPEAWRELPRSDAAVAAATYQGQAVGSVDPRDPLSRAVSRWAAELCARNEQPVEHAAAADQPVLSATWHERLLKWAS